jgi:drug/metabolite transporter (DMT)-like permease
MRRPKQAEIRELSKVSAGKNQVIQALALAAAGFSLLTIGDSIIKSIAGAWPGTAVAALRYGFGATGLAIFLAIREGRAGFTLPMPAIQFGRAAAVSISAACFFVGVYLMPLAEATSITFTSPMLTAIISAIILRESPTRTTVIATALAFAGVMIVLRPNVLILGPAALLPLIAALGMACMMIFNRMTAGTASVLALQFMVSVIAFPILTVFALAGHVSGESNLAVTVPDWSVVARCAAVAVTGSLAHTLIFMATARASAATIAPMTYVQMLLALAIGYVAFGDVPDAAALGGAALIVGSGLFLWWRQSASSDIHEIP